MFICTATLSLVLLAASAVGQRSRVYRSTRDTQSRVTCPSCFASCEELAHCHWQCRSGPQKSNVCHGRYCISRLDSILEDGYFMVRMGCGNQPPALNFSGPVKPFPVPLYTDLRSDQAELKSKEFRFTRTSEDTKVGWCYTSGSLDMPVEHCTCNTMDMCTLMDANAVLEAPRIRKKTQTCCEVPSYFHVPNWENECMSECGGAHCITDFVTKRKQCGMDLADFHPDIRPDFDVSYLPADEQICLKYEVSGEEYKLHRCVCRGDSCNRKMATPDYDGKHRKKAPPSVECFSCREAGPRDAVLEATSPTWQCNNTCTGHFCIVALQTAQLVQDYDPHRMSASLPVLEDNIYDLHTGCLRSTLPDVIRNDGCYVQWMGSDQPLFVRCICASNRCNTIDLLAQHVSKTMNLPSDWMEPQTLNYSTWIAPEGSGSEENATISLTTAEISSPMVTTEPTQKPSTTGKATATEILHYDDSAELISLSTEASATAPMAASTTPQVRTKPAPQPTTKPLAQPKSKLLATTKRLGNGSFTTVFRSNASYAGQPWLGPVVNWSNLTTRKPKVGLTKHTVVGGFTLVTGPKTTTRYTAKPRLVPSHDSTIQDAPAFSAHDRVPSEQSTSDSDAGHWSIGPYDDMFRSSAGKQSRTKQPPKFDVAQDTASRVDKVRATSWLMIVTLRIFAHVSN